MDSASEPTRPVTDRDLDVPALARLNEDAWEAVVSTLGPRLIAVARRLVRDESAAEDCVQDAFAQAVAHVGRFEGRAAFSTWLHRIVVNSALIVLRSRRRKPEESIEPLLPVFDRSGYRMRVGPVERTPEELAGCAEGKEILRVAIDLLPESYRTVLILRDIEDLSGDETATLLETTPNAVKIRLHRRPARRGCASGRAARASARDRGRAAAGGIAAGARGEHPCRSVMAILKEACWVRDAA